MNIKELRRSNLQLLIKEYGNRQQLSNATNVDYAQLSQWLLPESNPSHRNIRDSSARRLEEITGKPKYWLDTDHKKETVIAVFDDEIPEGVIAIPEYSISFSAGNGKTTDIQEIDNSYPAYYRKDWFVKEKINPKKCRRFRVSGDSNDPYICDGNVILVNLAETNIIDGNFYAIRYGDDLRVKKLSKKIDGSVVLDSVNPHYPQEIISPVNLNELFQVIGRVRDKSGM